MACRTDGRRSLVRPGAGGPSGPAERDGGLRSGWSVPGAGPSHEMVLGQGFRADLMAFGAEEGRLGLPA